MQDNNLYLACSMDEDCPMCTGEACSLCGAGCWNNSVTNCEHDVVQRHELPDGGQPIKEPENE